MAIGLISAEQITNHWASNTRRRIFYPYPNGTAPLTGLLALKDNKATPLPEFGWNEERWAAIKTQASVTAAPTTNVVWYTGGTTTPISDPYTVVQFASIRLYVADASQFQVDDTIMIFGLTLTSGTADMAGRVTLVQSTAAPFYIEFAITSTPFISTLRTAATFNTANYVYLMGSAFAEAARSRTGRQVFPV